MILTYNAALKQMETKIEILNDEFMHVHQYNPIEYVKTRIKTPESIVKKLKRYGYETSIQNMVKYCNDIAGVRVVSPLPPIFTGWRISSAGRTISRSSRSRTI